MQKLDRVDRGRPVDREKVEEKTYRDAGTHASACAASTNLQALTIASAANSRTFGPTALSSSRTSSAMPPLAWTIAIFCH